MPELSRIAGVVVVYQAAVVLSLEANANEVNFADFDRLLPNTDDLQMQQLIASDRNS
jgi:hypothetical protein